MSLRDQLVAKGLVSKKRAAKLERQLKHERRAQQGSRKKKRQIDAEAEASRREAAERESAERLAARRAREAARQAAEHTLRIRNLLVGNRLRPGRGHRFWHRSVDGRHLAEADVSSGVAFQLRCGEVALAHLDHSRWSEVICIPRAAALKLKDLAPDRLLFFVDDPSGISAPDLAFRRRDWDTELGPHRATDADLERFRGKGR